MNLLRLKNKMATVARAKADDTRRGGKQNRHFLFEELFLKSKGYMPETLRYRDVTHTFPPLVYPKRKSLASN